MGDDRLAIISVTYYSAEIIESFLDSVTVASHTVPRIVLVDNTPEDDGLGSRVGDDPRVAVVHPGSNLGYGGGMNYGVAQLPPDVDWVVLANPDVVMAEGSIDALLDAARRRPDAAAFGPLIRGDDGVVYPSARKLPSLRTGIGHATFVRIWPGNPWTTSYRNDLAAIEERTVGWLSGAFLLIRREAFEAVGGFDERYFMYFEDVDLGRNLGLAGWKNLYVPSAEVLHLGALSTSRSAQLMIRAHHTSAYRYLSKRYHHWYLLPVRLVLRVGLWARSHLAKG
ncbi:MAG TPA: dTDP-Rha--alpha-D-GlcNAc-pyrophosphate polyprenol alpha-3-L-rhamnosyltransferase [Microbacteriaceae bacterium]|jgi:N-acetylglucosaminyl-diphospho-decaprenol L-rhamnosyltransferase|nr:dTDP-Rha--alpha-D-GlcNAc-pyrophosphate polyprenol alpha-3-L-rhamnosyltransferase [Microbacteriaceae bacterium]